MDRATVEALASNVQSDEEAKVLAQLIVREGHKPEVLVTVQHGVESKRRYVVDHEDREAVLALKPALQEDPRDRPWFYFGARWLRAYGKVDEMHRSLSFSEVVKIEEADPRRVWGT
jgi:hypothetical protein